MVRTATLLCLLSHMVICTRDSDDSSKSPNKPNAEEQSKSLKYGMGIFMNAFKILQEKQRQYNFAAVLIMEKVWETKIRNEF